jgi:hypothetical protein
MRLANKRSGLGAAWLTGLLLGAGVPALWAERVAAQTPPAPSAGAPAPAEEPPPIEAIPLPKVAGEAEKTGSRLREIRTGLGEDPAFTAVEAAVPEVDRETAALARDTAKAVETAPPLRTLNKLEAQWRSATESLPQWESRLADRATKLGKWSKELDVLLETWQKTRTEARKARAPGEVLGRVDEEIAQIKDTQNLLAARLKRILALQNQVGDQRQRLANGLAIIQKARSETVTTLFAAGRPPVWSGEFRDSLEHELADDLSGSFQGAAKALVDYLEEHPERLPLQGVFFAIASLGLVAWRRRMRQRPQDDELRTGKLAQIFELPFSAALLIALLLGTRLYATPPPVFSQLVIAVALFPSVLILRRFIHPHLHLLLYATVVFYLVGLVSDFSAALPRLERVILMVQTLAGVALLGWLLRPARLGQIPPELAREPMLRVLSTGARVAFIGFAIAFLAAALGFERLAELVGDGILTSAYFALVIIALVHVGQSLAILVLRVRPLSLLGMVQRHRLLFQRRIHWLLQLGGFIWWGWLALDIFAVRRPLFAAVGAALTAELVMGSVRLSLGGVLGFAVTIWVAFSLSRFVRFVLEEDVYPRARLSRGRRRHRLRPPEHREQLRLGPDPALRAADPHRRRRAGGHPVGRGAAHRDPGERRANLRRRRGDRAERAADLRAGHQLDALRSHATAHHPDRRGVRHRSRAGPRDPEKSGPGASRGAREAGAAGALHRAWRQLARLRAAGLDPRLRSRAHRAQRADRRDQPGAGRGRDHGPVSAARSPRPQRRSRAAGPGARRGQRSRQPAPRPTQPMTVRSSSCGDR